MAASQLTADDVAAAEKYWRDYQASHDISARTGQTAGVEPGTGRVWFGDSIQDIVHQMDAHGVAIPLFFFRVGADTYWRKGGHR